MPPVDHQINGRGLDSVVEDGDNGPYVRVDSFVGSSTSSSSSSASSGKALDSVDEDWEVHVVKAEAWRHGIFIYAVFFLEVSHAGRTWTICKTRSGLLWLHIRLLFGWGIRSLSFPWFLLKPYVRNLEKEKQDVEKYLRHLTKHKKFFKSEAVLEFVGWSPDRLSDYYGESLLEMYVGAQLRQYHPPTFLKFFYSKQLLFIHDRYFTPLIRFVHALLVMLVLVPMVTLLIVELPLYVRYNLDGHSTGVLGKRHRAERILYTTLVFLGSVIIFLWAASYLLARLGTQRLWVAVKPSCVVFYKNRSCAKAVHVVLYDASTKAATGSQSGGMNKFTVAYFRHRGIGLETKSTICRLNFSRVTTMTLRALALGFSVVLLLYLLDIYMNWKAVDFSGIPTAESLPAGSVSSLGLPIGSTAEVACGFAFQAEDEMAVRIKTSDYMGYALYTLNKEGGNLSSGVDAAQAVLSLSSSDSFVNKFELKTVETYIRAWNGFPNQPVAAGTWIIALAYPAPTSLSNYLLATAGSVVLPSPEGGKGSLSLQGIKVTYQEAQDVLSLSNSGGYVCRIPLELNYNTSAWLYLTILGIAASSVIINVLIFFGLDELIVAVGLSPSSTTRDWFLSILQRHLHASLWTKKKRYNSYAPIRRVNGKKLAWEGKPEGSNKEAAPTCGATPGPPAEQGQSNNADHCLSIEEEEANFSGDHTFLKWHVDGEDGFRAMLEEMKKAEREIMLTAWWLCPDLYLLRPADLHPSSRLDEVLRERAEAGVKVYVLIYKEPKAFLTNASLFAKRRLLSHPNILVKRDPDFQMQDLGFWSHHEKILVMDQSIAFVGGLDPAFGRFDNAKHQLQDYQKPYIWPGKDYSNPRVKDFVSVERPYEDMIDREEVPRLPWHDVHCSMRGAGARDVARHFIERWNYVLYKKRSRLRFGCCQCCRRRRMKRYEIALLPRADPSELTADRSELTEAVCTVEQQGKSSFSTPQPSTSAGTPPLSRLIDIPEALDKEVEGPAAKVDFLDSPPLTSQPQTLEGETETVCHGPQCSPAPVACDGRIRCQVQVVRSVSLWSGGIPTESSIQSAYMEEIERAEHYIYIENQFFVSGLEGESNIQNRVLQALANRIVRAHEEGKEFRVFIFLPLMPGFEGEVGSKAATSLQGVMYWQYQTITRGEHSLYRFLEKNNIDPTEYIAFFGLRNYGSLPAGYTATEQIYIHSKIMIVDDRTVIIGSANINDRSLLGDRDSEIALVVQDVELSDGVLGGVSFSVGKLARDLRMQLLAEHLGMEQDNPLFRQLDDLASPQAWTQVHEIANMNSDIYHQVFRCLPTDQVKKFTDLSGDVLELFENEEWSAQEKAWKPTATPLTDPSGRSIDANSLDFTEYQILHPTSKVDRLLPHDREGWVYANDFQAFNQADLLQLKAEFGVRNRRERLRLLFLQKKWRSAVRRRRWIHKREAEEREDPVLTYSPLVLRAREEEDEDSDGTLSSRLLPKLTSWLREETSSPEWLGRREGGREAEREEDRVPHCQSKPSQESPDEGSPQDNSGRRVKRLRSLTASRNAFPGSFAMRRMQSASYRSLPHASQSMRARDLGQMLAAEGIGEEREGEQTPSPASDLMKEEPPAGRERAGTAYGTLSRLSTVQGHIVTFPLHFLEEEDLLPRYVPKSLLM